MDTWSLFGVAWLAVVAASVSLAVPGIMVVARGQIMLALAAGQSAAGGAAATSPAAGVSGSAVW